MSTLIPLNGVDQCYCGCKCWNYDKRCVDCGEPYEPDFDSYHDAILASMDDETEACRWEAAHYLDTERETHDDPR